MTKAFSIAALIFLLGMYLGRLGYYLELRREGLDGDTQLIREENDRLRAEIVRLREAARGSTNDGSCARRGAAGKE